MKKWSLCEKSVSCRRFSSYSRLYNYANKALKKAVLVIRINDPGKTYFVSQSFVFSIAYLFSLGNADILQILRALRSNGSATRGDAPSCTDLDNIVDLSLGQQRLLP